MLNLLEGADLGATPARVLPASVGYLAECVAYSTRAGRAFALGVHRAVTPRLALRWMRDRGRAVAEQLDPQALAEFQAWAEDPRHHDAVFAALAAGVTYEVQLADSEALYVLSVHRVDDMWGRATSGRRAAAWPGGGGE